MRTIFAFVMAVVFCLGVSISYADQKVNGYYKKNGTYVESYRRTKADRTYNNNYSTRGNVNPYHGARGTKPRDEDTYRPNRRNRW